MQDHSTVLELDRGRLVFLHNLQEVSLPPKVVAFPRDVLSRGLSLLFKQLPLLAFDPRQLGNREYANRVEAHVLRSGNAYPPGRWVHAEMDVLDALADNVHADLTKLNSRLHQYSA
jgi:hypothetical protein